MPPFWIFPNNHSHREKNCGSCLWSGTTDSTDIAVVQLRRLWRLARPWPGTKWKRLPTSRCRGAPCLIIPCLIGRRWIAVVHRRFGQRRRIKTWNRNPHLSTAHKPTRLQNCFENIRIFCSILIFIIQNAYRSLWMIEWVLPCPVLWNCDPRSVRLLQFRAIRLFLYPCKENLAWCLQKFIANETKKEANRTIPAFRLAQSPGFSIPWSSCLTINVFLIKVSSFL